MRLSRRDILRAAAVSPAFFVLPSRLVSAPKSDEIQAVVDKAVGFLSIHQGEDGSFLLTALTIAALIRVGVPPESPVIVKGLKYLEGNIKPDGGVYSKGLANYTTCLALIAFKEANVGGKYDKAISAASQFVKGLQYGDPDLSKDVKYGGVGYDAKSRPDLSNSHFMVEALLAAGVPKDDPTIKKALIFISRSQNLPGEYNDQPFAGKVADDDRGGFVYNPLDQNNPESNKRTAVGGLRSEGGMTYAGLKSLLYAGVGKDDPRVKAAVAWIRKHYTLSQNPGMGQAGLFCYYQTFAKAMDALGEDSFEDSKGIKHDWRQELFDELKNRQKPNGSWANQNKQYLENTPELATAFAVLALSYCRKK